jgi:WhiB family transcriptional regulator, redox-sensing transcriptional regulator
MVAHSVYPEDDDIPRHVEYARRLPDWMRDAACADHDPNDWFPERGDRAPSARAKQVCAQCLVRAECLAFAVREPMRDGIWGGHSPAERRRLK